MRVLIVANHNTGKFSPFVVEQVEAIRKQNIEIDFFGVEGKGFIGYLSNLGKLRKKIKSFNPDIVHAHYGLSGLLANLQRMVSVVTTYHGSDIHSGGQNLLFSRISILLSAYNIFVSSDLLSQSASRRHNQSVIPCGVDTTAIFPMEREKARKLLGWDAEGKYVLFAGAFANEVKNSPLAKAATSLIPDAQLMEMRGYNREQVNWAMNAANCLLMTSHREGSPQVVKEAMTCGTPIVSVDVGDVKDVIKDIDGCYIAAYAANDIAAKLRQAISFTGKTKGPQRIVERGLSNELIAKQILDIYKETIRLQ